MEQIYFNPLTAYMGGRAAQAPIGQQQLAQLQALQQLQAQQAQAAQSSQMQAQLQQLGQAFMAGDAEAGNALAVLDPQYAAALKSYSAPPEAMAPTKEERLVAALGGAPGTPEYARKLEEIIGKSGGGVSVNVGFPGIAGPAAGQVIDPGEFAKVQAKRAGALLDKYDLEAQQSSKLVPMVDDAVSLIKSGRVGSGKLADMRVALKSFGASIGLPVDVAAEERFIEISNALAQLQKAPGSGSTSDKDMDFYKQSVANINKTSEGNLMGLVAQATSAREKQERANQMNRWLAAGGNPLECQAWWDKNKRPAWQTAGEVAQEYGLDPDKFVPSPRQGGKAPTQGAMPAPIVIEAD